MWCSVQIRLVRIYGHRMELELEQRTWPWHHNDNCGVAMLSAIQERREYVRQVRIVDFLPAYNDVDTCSVCFARGASEYTGSM
jgi:hypothetical protein